MFVSKFTENHFLSQNFAKVDFLDHKYPLFICTKISSFYNWPISGRMTFAVIIRCLKSQVATNKTNDGFKNFPF